MGISLAPESLRSKCLPKGEAYAPALLRSDGVKDRSVIVRSGCVALVTKGRTAKRIRAVWGCLCRRRAKPAVADSILERETVDDIRLGGSIGPKDVVAFPRPIFPGLIVLKKAFHPRLTVALCRETRDDTSIAEELIHDTIPTVGRPWI